MNRSQKAMLGGVLIAIAGLVFVPSVYVTIASKLGKIAELRSATTGELA